MNNAIKIIGIGLVGAFLAFTANWIFIDRPAVYATKEELIHTREEICGDIKNNKARSIDNAKLLNSSIPLLRQQIGNIERTISVMEIKQDKLLDLIIEIKRNGENK